jgi:hypothetical protein
LKSVDLPTLGSPTMPHLKPMSIFPERRFDVARAMGERREARQA